MGKWISYTNRQSTNYRFTTTDRNDPMITELKQMVQNYYKPEGVKSYGVRVRGRGCRDGNTHDTPLKNARYFDVYVKKYYDYG